MAEGLLRSRLERLGRKDITVVSMGIHGLDKQPATELASAVCQENDIDITTHISRQLIPDQLKSADLILTMELVHKDFIKVFFPSVADRTYPLCAWPDEKTKKVNVKDPMGGNLNDYRKAYRTIEEHVDRILPFILARFPSSDTQP